MPLLNRPLDWLNGRLTMPRVDHPKTPAPPEASQNTVQKLVLGNIPASLRMWGESLPVACFALNFESDVVWTNSLCRKLVRFSSSTDIKQLLEGNRPDWLLPADAPCARDFFGSMKALRDGILETQLRVWNCSNEMIWLHLKVRSVDTSEHTLYGGDEKCRFYLFTCEDITAVKHSIVTLRHNEERSKKLLSGIKDAAVIVLNEEGFVEFCNDSIENVLGYSENELYGQHISILSPKTDLFAGKISQALELADSNAFHKEVARRIRKSGDGFWASILTTSLSAEVPYKKNYCVVIRDISIYKQEQKALNEWKNRFEQIANNVKEAFCIYDVRSAKTVYFSPVFAHLFGMTSEKEDAFFTDILRAIHPDDVANVRKFVSDLTLGLDARLEFRVVKQTSDVHWLSFKSFAVRDSGGRIYRMIGVAEDITENKNSQIALRESQESAIAANNAKSEFLANMSHEIRTPLGAMMGFAELIGNFQSSEDERHEALHAILRNGRQLSKIIDEILDLSKVEAGKIEVENETIELFSFLQDVTTLLSLQAREKGIGLDFQSDGLFPKHIRTDGTKLRQILINVVGNAIKFTDRGKVILTIGTELHEQSSKLYIRVLDTGLGLTPEQQSRLFHPFVQADSSTRRRFGGTGLGLVLSRRFARMLGGELLLDWSIPGQGSCFEISVNIGPAQQLNLCNVQECIDERVSENKAPNKLPSLSGTHILVVDDAPDNRFIVQKFLTHAGATVEHAEDGRTAARRALETHFDLIIMDIQMPEFDGYETVGYLREMKYRQPVIALSAHAMREDRERSLAAGFNEHLSKPVDRIELINRVHQFLQ